AGMLQHFNKLERPWETHRAVFHAVLIPGPVADFQPLVRLEEQFVAKEPKNRHLVRALGMAHHRAGQYEEALRRLSESCELHPEGGNAYDWFFLAMSHHHLGHADEARVWLEKATQWTEREAKKDGNVPWDEQVVRGQMRREAEALILEKPKPGAKKDGK